MGTADGVSWDCSNSGGEDRVAGMRQGSPTIDRSDAAATDPPLSHGTGDVVTSRGGAALSDLCLKDHLMPSRGPPKPSQGQVAATYRRRSTRMGYKAPEDSL